MTVGESKRKSLARFGLFCKTLRIRIAGAMWRLGMGLDV